MNQIMRRAIETTEEMNVEVEEEEEEELKENKLQERSGKRMSS